MAQAYALVPIEVGLFDHHREDAIRFAQAEADKKFEALAQEARMTLVTRDPEPRVMTIPEAMQQFPGQDIEWYRAIVFLYFTAEIS